MNSVDLTKYWFESADSDYKRTFDEKCTDDYTLEQ